MGNAARSDLEDQLHIVLEMLTGEDIAKLEDINRKRAYAFATLVAQFDLMSGDKRFSAEEQALFGTIFKECCQLYNVDAESLDEIQ